jgi:hypothetical protein
MMLSSTLTTSLWYASKVMAILGVLLCLIPARWGLSMTVASHGVYIAMKDVLPVVFFCLAAFIGIAAWIAETQRLVNIPH